MSFEQKGQSGAGAAGGLPPAFELKPREYDAIRVLVKEKTGISLGLHKRDLVVSRLAKRLRALGLSGFQQYLDYLQGEEGADELVQMINRITTNKTDFFREKHHFDFLNDTLLPSLYEAGESSGNRKVRAWSAGCSSGEEPYTICMVAAEFFQNKPGWDFKLLATDLDTTMLQKGSAGTYEARLLEPVPRNLLSKHFNRVKRGSDIFFEAKESLRSMITFRKFNLMYPSYPLKIPMDFIFCRNVLIYFDQQDKIDIMTKFHKTLKPGGYMFVGHSESLMMVRNLYQHVGTTVYLRV